MLTDIADLYQRFPGRIVPVGHSPTTNTNCYARPRFVELACPDMPRIEHDKFKQAAASFLRTAGRDRFCIVEPVDQICPNLRACATLDGGGHVLYTDAHHLSDYGAAQVAPEILRGAGVFRNSEMMSNAAAERLHRVN